LFKQILFSIFILTILVSCAKKPIPPQDINASYHNDKTLLMFILDASGSMNEKDANKTVKIEGAKNTLHELSKHINRDKTDIGLISFSRGCKSAKLLLKPTHNNLETLLRRVDNIKPAGRTPLAASIRTTFNTIKDSNQSVNIVIISDGLETCKGDPVKEAKRLKETYDNNVTIDVIGYSVDYRTKYELQDLAEAGGGKYYDAQDATALNNILRDIGDNLNITKVKKRKGPYTFLLNFNDAQEDIVEENSKKIEELALYLKETKYSAEIQGHTDSRGIDSYNKYLSQKMAQSVVDRLILFGVNKEQIHAVGYGEIAHIATNQTKEGRLKNRRVEAKFVRNDEMDIENINYANHRNLLKTQEATQNAFVGYYKVKESDELDAKYTKWIELYSNNSGIYGEYQNENYIATDKNNSVSWFYQKKSNTMHINYSNSDKKSGWDEFSGEVSGYTDEFIVSRGFGRGEINNLVLTRVLKEELDCMKKQNVFLNNICYKPSQTPKVALKQELEEETILDLNDIEFEELRVDNISTKESPSQTIVEVDNIIIGGVGFADRAITFFKKFPNNPLNSNTKMALGEPDSKTLSLSCGGSATFEFVYNRLTDIEGDDLFIYELDSEVEPTKVEISKDGRTWVDVGQTLGGKSAIDIAPYVKKGEKFRFIRLTDLKFACYGDFPGADIDAISIIGTNY